MTTIYQDDTTEPEVLWEQRRYEGGWYNCRVVRTEQAGELSVTLVGTVDFVLHREPVKVEKLAIDTWKAMSLEAINNPDVRKFP